MNRAPRWSGLRAKIIAWFLIPTAIILSAVAVMVFTASQRVTEDLVFSRTEDRVQLLAHQLAETLETYQPPTAVALSQSTTVAQDSAHVQAQLQRTLDAQWPVGPLGTYDAGILVLAPDGEVTAAVPSVLTRTDPAVIDLLRDIPPRAFDVLPVSNVLHSEVLATDVVAYAVPLFDPTAAMGAEQVAQTVVGLFRVERSATRNSTFYQDIWQLYIGRQLTATDGGGGTASQTIAYLVDGNGVIIFHPDTFLIGEAAAGAPVERALAGEAGAIRTAGLDGQEVVAGYTPVPRTPWVLVTEEPWSEIIQASRPYTRLMIVLLVLGALVPVLVVALGVRRITRPLRRLTTAAQALASGDFNQTIDVQTGDELETLGEQFNVMAQELQASYTTLEQRVADRTRELATLNRIASVVGRSLELEQVLDAALATTLDAMQVDAGAAFRLNEGGLELIAAKGLSEAFIRQVVVLPVSSDDGSDEPATVAATALRRAVPVVRAVAAYPEAPLKQALMDEGLVTVIGLPLIAKGEVVGVLTLAARAPRALSPDERALLASIGLQAGIAVENARLYEQAEVSAATAERNRLARDLHDAVSQTLFTASLIAEVVPQLWEINQDEARHQLQVLRRLTRGALAEMRTLLMELRPSALVETDIATLLGQLARAVAGRAEITIDLDLAPVSPLPDDVKVALYRIAQEALNNVAKHAEATRATVALHTNGNGASIALAVCDNGRGFDLAGAPADHFGLSNMRERAAGIDATLEIKTAPGAGTCVTVIWRGETERGRRYSHGIP